MKKLFALLILCCFVAFGQSSNIGRAFIYWVYPGYLSTNNVFKIYSSTNEVGDVSKTWTLLTNVNGASSSVYVDYPRGYNVNYLISVSNMWGETIFLKINYPQNNILR